MAKKVEDEVIKQALTPRIQKTTRKDIQFFPSGITLLDLSLGGGFGIGCISNICGGESTGKTMIALETIGYCTNIDSNFGHIFDNAESGFTIDTKYMFGFQTNIKKSNQVEHFKFSVESALSKLKDKSLFYVLDSLDGLSDDREQKHHIEEMKRIKKAIEEEKEDFGKQDYDGKAKKMSEFFRILNGKIEKKKMHLMILSQLRDKIGVIYGRKEDRTGGKALNYYSSQIIWLKTITKIGKKITIEGNTFERETGVLIRVDITKNKLGKPFRRCYLFVDFDYGVDNVKSNIYFLYNLISPEGKLRKKCLKWGEEEFNKAGDLTKYIEKNNLEAELERRVIELWNKIEENCFEKRKKKYEKK